jgi:hypothetical protein
MMYANRAKADVSRRLDTSVFDPQRKWGSATFSSTSFSELLRSSIPNI